MSRLGISEELLKQVHSEICVSSSIALVQAKTVWINVNAFERYLVSVAVLEAAAVKLARFETCANKQAVDELALDECSLPENNVG
jgi:hypothetical protein